VLFLVSAGTVVALLLPRLVSLSREMAQATGRALPIPPTERQAAAPSAREEPAPTQPDKPVPPQPAPQPRASITGKWEKVGAPGHVLDFQEGGTLVASAPGGPDRKLKYKIVAPDAFEVTLPDEQGKGLTEHGRVEASGNELALTSAGSKEAERYRRPGTVANAPTKPADQPPEPSAETKPAEPKLQELILGQWQDVIGLTRDVLDFQEGGSVIRSRPGAPERKGTYSFVGDDLVELSVPTESGTRSTRQVHVQVSKEELVLSNPEWPAAERLRRYDPAKNPSPQADEDAGPCRQVSVLTQVPALAFSPDGKTLAVGSGDSNSRIQLWDAAALKKTGDLEGHDLEVYGLAFSPDGKTLASGGADKTVRLWNVQDRKSTAVLKGHANLVLSVAFSPDGKTLASCGSDATVRLWDAASGENTATLKGYDHIVYAVAFNQDGTLLASAGADKMVKLWDVAGRKETATLTGHTDAVRCLAFSRDGAWLASGSADKTIKVWEVATRKDTATLTGHADAVKAVAFNKDGKTLASAGADKTVRLWDVSAGRNTAILSGHSQGVWALAYSPDGKTLASAGDDGTLCLWDMPPKIEPPGPEAGAGTGPTLKGTWVLGGTNVSGKGSATYQAKIAFRDNEAEWDDIPLLFPPGKGALSLDSSKSPPTVELKFDNKVYRGIYQIRPGNDGDTLWMLLSEPGGEAPKAFADRIYEFPAGFKGTMVNGFRKKRPTVTAPRP
jgi:WD40 repeat protein